MTSPPPTHSEMKSPVRGMPPSSPGDVTWRTGGERIVNVLAGNIGDPDTDQRYSCEPKYWTPRPPMPSLLYNLYCTPAYSSLWPARLNSRVTSRRGRLS